MTDYSELKRLAEAAMVAHSTFAENSKAAILYGEASEADVVLALIAENEALRKDAERYREMRRVTLMQLDGDTEDDFDREFDAQIKSAMSKEG